LWEISLGKQLELLMDKCLQELSREKKLPVCEVR
jgi:hypothetical protein